MQNATTQRPSLWARIKRAFGFTGPDRPLADVAATAEAVLDTLQTAGLLAQPRYLGGFERRPDGHLMITHLLSTDILFELGCHTGDVVHALDGVDAPRIPDDLLYSPNASCTRAIVTRDSVLFGHPDSEYGEHPDLEIRQTRIDELMKQALRLLSVDPLFPVRNRLEGPPPAARADAIQPENTPPTP